MLDMPPALNPVERRSEPTVGGLMTHPRPLRAGAVSALILSLGLGSGVVGGGVYASLRKDLTIVVAGNSTRRLTFKGTVAQVLADAGIALEGTDEVSPSPQSSVQDGLTVTVRRVVQVTIAVDGKRLQGRSAAARVGGALRGMGVALGPEDKAFPSIDAPLTPNTEIRVVRMVHQMVAQKITIPNGLKSSRDPTHPRGTVRVLQPGRTGLKERQFKVILVDGVVVSRELVGERIVQTPLDRVIEIGSRVLIASRGEFAGREYLDMVATAYSPYCCEGVFAKTAIGLTAGYGVVAVDPEVIPLGSELYVEGYGHAIAGDTGGDIKGLRIDLGFNTKQEALRFGRQTVRVYILAVKKKA